MALRVVFMGTPDYGVPSLEALISAGYDVVGVFCQPDKPSGRGKRIAFCPVKQCALAHGIPVVQPVKTRVDGVEPLRALKPDLCVTAAFGHILSQEVLDIPRIGTVNVHASLLPKYRGSAPVNWALIQGETVTGVTTMMTDKGMDTGDILLKREVAILPQETAGELVERLARVGAELLIETLRAIERGDCPRVRARDIGRGQQRRGQQIGRLMQMDIAQQLRVSARFLSRQIGALPGHHAAYSRRMRNIGTGCKRALWLTRLKRAGEHNLKGIA